MGITKKSIIFPLVLIFSLWLTFTWKFWAKGLVPAPLDFLVSFYAPWQSQYPLPAKNPAISDVVNQIIPWKLFTIAEWQSGRVPLWNSYNFSGTPHAANWQSAVFYPANLFPLVLDFIDGWSLYVLIQPLLASIFTYLFCRSLKLSSLSSMLSALSFAFSGFMTSWLEWGTLGHAILWLPASLWVIEKYLVTRHSSFLILNSLFLSLSLLAGHLQISLYVIATSLAYFIFRSRILIANKRSILVGLVALGATPFFLISFQLFPTIQLYFNSVRSQSIDIGWFNYFRIPVEYLTTFIAPDFFGNPTTRNEWGRGSYVEMMGYIGFVPLILSLGVLKITPRGWKPDYTLVKTQSFFTWVIIAGLILGLRTPLANTVTLLKVPVLATSSPARIICLISFSLSILAGIGLDYALKTRLKSLKWPILITGLVLVSMWLIALIIKIPVAQRNLIIPSGIFMLILLANLIGKLVKKKSLLRATGYALLAITIADLYRFHHKFTPYSSREYWYPKIPVIEKLQQIQGENRSFGLFDANLNLPFRIYSVEGYDALFPKNYAELISTQKTGVINLPNRVSGAQIGKNEPNTVPLLNQLGVKYVIQPTIHGSAPWELHLWEYPQQFTIIYDDGAYQILTNNLASPNPFMQQSITMTSQSLSFTIGLVVSFTTIIVLLSLCYLKPSFFRTTYTRAIK